MSNQTSDTVKILSEKKTLDALRSSLKQAGLKVAHGEEISIVLKNHSTTKEEKHVLFPVMDSIAGGGGYGGGGLEGL